MRWPAEKVLTMACAIFRTKGFTSTSSVLSSDPTGELRWTSKDHLSYQMVPSLASKDYNALINVTKDDEAMSEAIIKYYRKLTFSVLGDNINDYMQRVFATTQNSEVGFKDFGVIASVPSVYEKEITKKRIMDESKKTNQEHLGEIGHNIELNVRYINIRFIEKLNCYAHDAITDSNHLINFLNKMPLGQPGQTQKIRAKVKNHGVNFITKTIETQLNYVKILDREFIWQ